MTELIIHQIPALADNYIYLLRDPVSKKTAAIDPSDSESLLSLLGETGWTLHYILNTHHHSDHTAGNLELKEITGCQIIGSKTDAARIPGIDRLLEDGQKFQIGEIEATVMETPGHTRGHLCYFFPGALFSGDTLFTLGCGRLFEGTAEQMWRSLDRLRDLPETTKLYCGHEYTEQNGRWAVTLEEGNPALVKRLEEVQELRQQGKPTVPSTIGEEKETNPFLRPESLEIQEKLGRKGKSLSEVFRAIRQHKDRF